MYLWFLPYTCLLCGDSANRIQDLCQACLDLFPILPQTCPLCANFLSSPTTACSKCLEQPPPFTATYALYVYQYPLTRLITELKFQHHLLNAQILGELMRDRIQAAWYQHTALPDRIIPMPLHPTRLRERGFNQALEIARPIAKGIGIPIDYRSCLRIKETAPQTIIPAHQREQNVKDAFLIQQDFTGLHIAVLDDVITTGHTITAFSQALKNAGAHRIDIWCCAKTIKSPSQIPL